MYPNTPEQTRREKISDFVKRFTFRAMVAIVICVSLFIEILYRIFTGQSSILDPKVQDELINRAECLDKGLTTTTGSLLGCYTSLSGQTREVTITPAPSITTIGNPDQ